VIGNAGTLISFRVGSEGAPLLATEFQPKFEVLNLLNLPNYAMYLRLMIDGVARVRTGRVGWPQLGPLIGSKGIITDRSVDFAAPCPILFMGLKRRRIALVLAKADTLVWPSVRLTTSASGTGAFAAQWLACITSCQCFVPRLAVRYA